MTQRTKRAEQGGTFVAAVHGLVRRIPRGRIATYSQIAASLGRPRAARAVGWAMKHCPPGVPWHRVVNAHGGISRRPNAGSMLTQRLLLEREGVRVRRGRVSLGRYGWENIRSRWSARAERPLDRPECQSKG